MVDDQPARLLTYRAILEPLGHNLVAVNSGLEALDALMKQEFAVVLLDVKMPGMDGFETAELIHDHPRFETIPIIFVTGVHVTEFDRLKGYKAGAIDYVYIPVIPEILRSKVAVLVELYAKRRELQAVNKELAESNKQLADANYSLQLEKTRELEEINGAPADAPTTSCRAPTSRSRPRSASACAPRTSSRMPSSSATSSSRCSRTSCAIRCRRCAMPRTCSCRATRRIRRSSGRAASSSGSSST